MVDIFVGIDRKQISDQSLDGCAPDGYVSDQFIVERQYYLINTLRIFTKLLDQTRERHLLIQKYFVFYEIKFESKLIDRQIDNF